MQPRVSLPKWEKKCLIEGKKIADRLLDFSQKRCPQITLVDIFFGFLYTLLISMNTIKNSLKRRR